jgi:hypothetical protein
MAKDNQCADRSFLQLRGFFCGWNTLDNGGWWESRRSAGLWSNLHFNEFGTDVGDK